MKKTLLMLTAALTFTACTPLVTTGAGLAQGTQAGVITQAGVFEFRNGDAVPALKVVVILDGITTTDARCKATPDGITSCRFGDVPGNSAAPALAFIGTLAGGSVTWRTPEGKLRALPVAGTP